jgi:hypothetical protein
VSYAVVATGFVTLLVPALALVVLHYKCLIEWERYVPRWISYVAALVPLSLGVAVLLFAFTVCTDSGCAKPSLYDGAIRISAVALGAVALLNLLTGTVAVLARLIIRDLRE